MAGTRSSARLSQGSSPPSSAKSNTGTKRKADDSSPARTKSKRGRPSKEQKTLEEVVPVAQESEAAPETETEAVQNGQHDHQNGVTHEMQLELAEMHGNGANGHSKVVSNGENSAEDSAPAPIDPGESFQGKTKEGEDKSDPEKSLKDSRGGPGLNALDSVKADETDAGKTSKEDEEKQGEGEATTGGSDVKADAVQEDKKREEAQPSNILEKGIIYFFTRGRVGVEDPDSVQDLQRSFFVLRPLPAGAKITDGAIQDLGNNRLLALPKKVWPKSGKDRFMVFVEKAKTTMEALKEEFFEGSEYSTKTVGTRQTPNVTPIGEGVYAITSTGGGQGVTHLAYMLTIPTELGEVQNDVGLRAKGSFVLSLKNPESSGPANAQLPTKPDYPQEFIDEFRGRGWMPVQPKHIDYSSAQMLLIGEDFETSGNLEPTAKEQKSDSIETPLEELEKLEGEDEHRVEHLKGDDTVFADLGISSQDYPKVMTTW